MRYRSTSTRIMVLLVSIAIAGLGLVSSAHAGMIGTQEYLAAEEAAEARDQVAGLLEKEAVRDQLLAHGVDPADVEDRLAALSDEEMIQLAEEMEELPAGAGVSSIVSAAVLVFLVLLITDILGLTDVFPFTK